MVDDSSAVVGILLLNTRFPRIPGDIGNETTWPFPVRFRIVQCSSPDAVIHCKAAGLLDEFVDAANDLVAEGVSGITTSCGFLSLLQRELSNAVDVPVASSSLMQAAMIKSVLPPKKRVGILTISAESLTEEHLRCADVPEGTAIMGTGSDTEFSRVFLNDHPTIDFDKANVELVAAAQSLLRENPSVGAILLECTNMAPFARHISNGTGLPVFSMYTFVSWFQAGLVPRSFPRSR